MSGSITEEAPAQPSLSTTHESHSPLDVSYTESQLVTLRAVQASLRAHQIEADIPEIVHALLEALATRPGLCRGLVAAYLLGA
jgi:hypothetical protein